MISQNIYFVDMNIIYHIFMRNIWYLTKLLIVAYAVFYWIPTKVFPQEYSGKGIKKVIINFVYMTAYVETVVPLLVFIKAFSLFIFIASLFATRLLFLKFYYHKDLLTSIEDMKNKLMISLFTILDKTREVKEKGKDEILKIIAKKVKNITLYSALQNILFFAVFTYIISVLIARGMYSYSNPVSDTAQFINWVDNLQNNILYASDKSAGADFYGISVMIFFVGLFTNIDIIILFSVYPILLLLALYLSIYFVLKDFTNSKYTAIFAVMIHGIVFLSPLSDLFLGRVVTTYHPELLHFLNFSIYIPKAIEVLQNGMKDGYIPYIRYISGMAYEHSSVFVLLNAYFLIKTLYSKLDRDLLLYGLTLMLVFIFHGGGAITLIVISILIAINSVIFGKIDLPILKKGLSTVILAAILGNFWILSMLKYGIPQDFGAAAPILDKLFGTARNTQELAKKGIEAISISNITPIHLTFIVMIILGYIFSLFTKKRFLNTSFLLIPLGTFIIYFGPNLGTPMLASQSRLAEYLLFAMMLVLSFYYYYLLCKPAEMIFKKYAKYIMLTLSYIIFLFLTLSTPRWMDTYVFWKDLNAIEYTSISDIILRISKENRPFSWTVVSYVQEYAKVRNKGYHINTQNFLLRYDPTSRDLKIATKYIYIFVENFPNPYQGKGEWYYRWRRDIQNDLKSWIAIYSANHRNIRIYYKGKTITVYKIDNNRYIKYLEKMKKIKRAKRLKNEHF